MATALAAAFGLAITLLRGRRYPVHWAFVVDCAGVLVAALAVLRWRVSLLRRAFAGGVEVRARVTHLARFAMKDDPGDEAWKGFTRVVPSLRWAPETTLRVVYASEGGERTAQYTIEDALLRRTRAVVGGEVVLLVDPALSKPLLRDAYLDP